jgi:internalin A
MSSQPEPTSRPWHRYLRFSTRGLIVLVLLIGSWLGWIIRSARIQREAVAAIERAGGSVQYRSAETKSRSWWPKPLVDRLGVDYFDHVVGAGTALPGPRRPVGPDRTPAAA